LAPNWKATAFATVLIGFFVTLGMLAWLSLAARVLPTTRVPTAIIDRDVWSTTSTREIRRYAITLLLPDARRPRTECPRELFDRTGLGPQRHERLYARLSVLGGRPVTLEIESSPMIIFEGQSTIPPRLESYSLLTPLLGSALAGAFFAAMTSFLLWSVLRKRVVYIPVFTAGLLLAAYGGFRWWLASI
jgi:hypothetical protein